LPAPIGGWRDFHSQTGWAQVRYSYGATVEDAMEKLQFDLFYIKNFSISHDLFIIFETMKTVVLRKGV
jgi:lipopolysaccharide/colanic/teichoic acid biosynthesis glycosyltransferase